MTSPASSSRRFLRVVSVGWSLSWVALSFSQTAIDTPFTDSLVSTEQSATGLNKLTGSQRDELNRQITRELTLARQGNVTGFATTFTQRRTEKQRKDTGLDQLTSNELASLESVIARTMATPSRPGTVARATAVDSIETVRLKPRVHGEVGFTVGAASGGRSFYGGNMSVVYEDPNSGVTTAIAYSQYRGDGIFFGGPGWYSDGYYRPGFSRGFCR